MIMIVWQMMDGGSGGVSQFFIVKTFFNMAIGRDVLEKKSLGGRDFFQRPPAPTHEIFSWVGALFKNYFIRKINVFY